MDKETAKKFEKDLSTLLEKYGMKHKGSDLLYGIHTTTPKQVNDVLFVTHTIEFYELLKKES